MLMSLLLRLTMVAFTLAIIGWIGWSVPGSQDPEPPPASASQQLDARPVEPPPSTTPQTPVPPQERRQERSARRPAGDTLDLNSATEQDLERLPGIGHVLASRIIAYRTAQGAFQDIEQLRRVKGIGRKKFEQIRSLVAVARAGLSKPARKTA